MFTKTIEEHSWPIFYFHCETASLKAALTYLLLCFCILVRAQDYAINIKSWNVRDGLSERQVNGIYRDSRGFIWACTKNGINFFDGYSFKAYTKDKDGLPFEYIAGMTEDASGSFWILGSARLDSNNLFIFDPLARKVTSFRDKTGYQTTFRFNFLQKFNDSTLFFGRFHENYFFTWHPKLGLRSVPYPVPVSMILTVSDHNSFWARSDSTTLCEIDMNGKLLAQIPTGHVFNSAEPAINNFAVYTWAAQQKHTLKFVSDIRVKNGRAELTNTYPNFTDVIFNTGLDSIVYRQGILYHPTKGILADFVKDGFPDLKSNLTQVLLDSDGRIWMSNTYGLYMFTITRSRFRKYFHQDEKTFSQNSYRSMVIDNNCLYALNEFLGIRQAKIDSNANCAPFLSTPLIHVNYSLAKTTDGTILGVQANTVFSLQKNSKKWDTRNFQYSSKNLTWKIKPVGNDSFLLGTSEGLRWLNTRAMRFSDFRKYNEYDELTGSIILDIVPDRNGHEWLCSNTGLYEYTAADGVITRYSSADTGHNFLPSRDFQHLYQDAGGTYWISTVNGLLKWNKQEGKHRLYTRDDGLSNNNIYSVYEDTLGRLWMSSDYGIMQFDKATGSVRTYLKEDGITYNEFNRVSHIRDSLGNIYFGTLNGVTSFNPRDFPPGNYNEKGAQLSVSFVEQFNGKINRLEDKTADVLRTGIVTLNPGDRFFNINFALLTFNDAIHNTYYWRIEGIDSGWNKIRDPLLRLSGLPYGKWTLHIKAQAATGYWGRNDLRIQVNVVKPLYLQFWFLVSLGLVILICFISWYRWRVYNLRKENERLDNIVKQKTDSLEKTIAELELASRQKDILMKEIHHRVKNNLQVISTLLNLQLSKIKDEAVRLTIEEGVSRISSIALIHHHLYKGTQLTAIEMSVFIKELLEQVSSVYQKRDQKISFQNGIPEMFLDIDTALPVGLILNELMTNSYKYAFAEASDCKLQIDLTFTGNEYRLEYCDNGPGLPENYDVQTIRSLGMIIIKSLTKQLGGNFSYNKHDNCFVIIFKDAAGRRNVA